MYQKIIKDNISFPDFIDEVTKDLISKVYYYYYYYF